MFEIPKGVKIYVVLISLLSIYPLYFFFSGLLKERPDPFNSLIFLFLIVLTGLKTIKICIRKGDTGEIEIAPEVVVVFAAILVLGIKSGIAISIIGSLIVLIVLRTSPLKIIFDLSAYVSSLFVGSFVYLKLNSPEPLFQDINSILAIPAFIFLSYLSSFIIYSILLSLLEEISLTKSSYSFLKEGVLTSIIISLFIFAPVSVLFSFLYDKAALISFLIFVPLLALYKSTDITREAGEETRETLEALARAIDARDKSTYGHSERVSRVSEIIGRRLRLNDRALEELRNASLLHDIGKIVITDRVLHKPGPLTPAEYEYFKIHPIEGAKILSRFKELKGVSNIALLHHERVDGKGYPFNLGGDRIPLPSRILSVADAYDAITSIRPYRKELSEEEALEVIKGLSGTHFDPLVVRAFIESFEEVKPITKKYREEIKRVKIETFEKLEKTLFNSSI